jgi:hypothetical protein
MLTEKQTAVLLLLSRVHRFFPSTWRGIIIKLRMDQISRTYCSLGSQNIWMGYHFMYLESETQKRFLAHPKRFSHSFFNGVALFAFKRCLGHLSFLAPLSVIFRRLVGYILSEKRQNERKIALPVIIYSPKKYDKTLESGCFLEYIIRHGIQISSIDHISFGSR